MWSKLLAGKYRRNLCRKGKWWRINFESSLKMYMSLIKFYISQLFHGVFKKKKKDKSIVSRIINDFLFQLIIPVKGNTTEFLHFFLFLFLLDKVLWATDFNLIDWSFLFNYPKKNYDFWLWKNLGYPKSCMHKLFPHQGLLPKWSFSLQTRKVFTHFLLEILL